MSILAKPTSSRSAHSRLDYVSGGTLHSTTANGIASGSEVVILHLLTSLVQVAGCLLHDIWIASPVQVQAIEFLDHLIYFSSPKFIFTSFYPSRTLRFSLSINSAAYSPQTLCTMRPIRNLSSFGKVHPHNTFDPRRTIINRSEMFQQVTPSSQPLRILIWGEGVCIPQPGVVTVLTQTNYVCLSSFPSVLPLTVVDNSGGHSHEKLDIDPVCSYPYGLLIDIR